MASTILPNDRCTTLPITPTHGQRFIDAQLVQWIYEGTLGVWERRGTADNIPLATPFDSGLMSPQQKNLLDGTPAIGGGFGIITDAKLLLQSPTNPEGVITGDISLRSESLDIVCVGPDLVKLECALPPEMECATADGMPGLSFKLSDKFKDTLFVNARGQKGKQGHKGDDGKQGDPGFSEGPEGKQGNSGKAIDTLCELTSITYNDIDGITDTAIVDLGVLDDDGHGCKLVATKSKINVPEDRPADKLIAVAISRSVSFMPVEFGCAAGRLDDWSLAQASSDTTVLNMQLLRLPKGSEGDNPTGFNGTMTLEDFVGDIVAEYKSRLTDLDEAWGKEVKAYIESIDDKARGILSDLSGELSMCEFNLPAVEYGITFTGCGQPSSPSPVAALRADASNETLVGSNKIMQIGMGKRSWNVKL